MSQETLLLFVLAVFGLYSVRWTRRLAPLGSELPLKTLLATLLCALFGALALTGTRVPPALRALVLLFGALYILAPLVLTGLARWRHYNLAARLAELLYWTPAGQGGIKRLIAQVALHHEDAEAVLALLPDGAGDVLRLQVYALQGRWHEVLAFPIAGGGDNLFLGLAARVQAHLGLHDEAAAEDELTRMVARWEAQGQGPLGYRSITLSRARLAAYRGDLAGAQRELQNPLPGVSPHRALEILAQAAERAANLEAAGRLYAQAYAYAPPRAKERLEGAVRRYGGELPEVPRRHGATVTTVLTGFLLALYLVQLWVDNRYGARSWALTAGFLTLPDARVPGASALWRYLSYAFVHGGVVHIALNAWVLFDIGRLYEARRPWGSLLAAFVFGSVMGAYLTFVSQGGAPPGVIGASGGVLGVAGALLADTWRGRSARDRLLTRSLVQWSVLIVLFSLLLPGVSLWGHIGGLVGGLLWGFMRQGLPQTPRLDRYAGLVSVAALAYALFGALSWLVRFAPQL
jgi:membrane associated rhomboid family serine protease